MNQIIGAIDGSAFALVYLERRDEIARVARGQKVVGLDYDDVVAELTTCLWRAWTTYDETLPFGTYWWSIWLNRKADLIGMFFAKKNPAAHTSALENEAITEAMSPLVMMVDLCPSTDPTSRVVWWMLSQGFTGLEIRKSLRISWRVFYRIVESWRTPEIRMFLLRA